MGFGSNIQKVGHPYEMRMLQGVCVTLIPQDRHMGRLVSFSGNPFQHSTALEDYHRAHISPIVACAPKTFKPWPLGSHYCW